MMTSVPYPTGGTFSSSLITIPLIWLILYVLRCRLRLRLITPFPWARGVYLGSRAGELDLMDEEDLLRDPAAKSEKLFNVTILMAPASSSFTFYRNGAEEAVDFDRGLDARTGDLVATLSPDLVRIRVDVCVESSTRFTAAATTTIFPNPYPL